MNNVNMSKERWELVTENESLVNITLLSMANKMPAINEDLDDYKEAAIWALINSANKFDFSRNIKFSTYAITSIRREIIKKFNQNTQNRKRFKEEDFSFENATEHFSGNNVLENMIKNEELNKVKAILEKLPEKWRKIVQLRFVEGKTFAEIGKEFSVTSEMARMYCKKVLGLIESEMAGVE